MKEGDDDTDKIVNVLKRKIPQGKVMEIKSEVRFLLGKVLAAERSRK